MRNLKITTFSRVNDSIIYHNTIIYNTVRFRCLLYYLDCLTLDEPIPFCLVEHKLSRREIDYLGQKTEKRYIYSVLAVTFPVLANTCHHWYLISRKQFRSNYMKPISIFMYFLINMAIYIGVKSTLFDR